jgi:hypothetical protein
LQQTLLSICVDVVSHGLAAMRARLCRPPKLHVAARPATKWLDSKIGAKYRMLQRNFKPNPQQEAAQPG